MTTQTFADRLQIAIDAKQSVLCAGLDPKVEDLPGFVTKKIRDLGNSFSLKEHGELLTNALVDTYQAALEELAPMVPVVKPNLAFFEQYGLPGLTAYDRISQLARQHGLLIIADAKRGDIGSTAKAYSSAFLGHSVIFGSKQSVFDADALTVNPFLGFDTIEEFLKDCESFGKGLFILVKTSNPGSAALQGLVTTKSEQSVSDHVAAWISQNANRLVGSCGLSGLGAVVGATYPSEAQHLRAKMSQSFFLIPGLGAQGGSAHDAVQGFAKNGGKAPRAGLVNVSRGLFQCPQAETMNEKAFRELIRERAQNFNQQLSAALKESQK